MKFTGFKYFKISDATLRTFNVTREEMDELLVQQNWVCGLCEQPFTRTPCIDHDHVSDKVRGLLCVNCNVGLGHFKDEIKRLARAIVYLERHSEKINNPQN